MHPFITSFFCILLLLLFLSAHTVSSHPPQPLPPKRPLQPRRGGHQRRPKTPRRTARPSYNPLPQPQPQPQPQNPNPQITRQDQKPKNPSQNQNPNPGKVFGWEPRVETTLSDGKLMMESEFLYAHNWVRRKYNLPPFVWDEKLAIFARQYLTQRYADCMLVHSSGSYGENLFWGKKNHWTPSDAVFFWYMEKDSYDFRTRKCFPPTPDSPKSCGHFTQIVWRESLRLGCAMQQCRDAGAGMLIACEYDPPGNYDNENPF